jgi:hypothetical protein
MILHKYNPHDIFVNKITLLRHKVGGECCRVGLRLSRTASISIASHIHPMNLPCDVKVQFVKSLRDTNVFRKNTEIAVLQDGTSFRAP